MTAGRSVAWLGWGEVEVQGGGGCVGGMWEGYGTGPGPSHVLVVHKYK